MTDETTPPEVAASVDPGPYGRARWKVRLAVTFFVLILIAVTGEGLARLTVKRETPLWVDHPLCWRVPSPDVKAQRRSGDEVWDYETNHFGFRGRSLEQAKKPADVYRIFFLGGDALLDPDRPETGTAPAIVERELGSLRGDKDLKVEVANAAGPGFFAPVLHATLVHRVLPLEPDLVVVMSVANDVRASIATRWDPRGEGYGARSEPLAFGDWLCGVSDFADWMRRFGRAHGLAALPPARTPVDDLGPPDAKADPRRGLESYRRQLHLMALACKDAKAELVLLTQPTLHKETLTPEETARIAGGPSEQLRKGIDAFNEELRAEAPRSGARLVDMANLMTRDLNHLRDAVHFTPTGHGVLAHVLVEEVFRGKPATRRP